MSAKKKTNKLDASKQRVRILLELLEASGHPIPVVSSAGSNKAFRSRAAGAAGDKKRERRNAEAKLVAARLEQLESEVARLGLLGTTNSIEQECHYGSNSLSSEGDES